MTALKEISVINPTTAVGAVLSERARPIVAGNAEYGFIPSNFRTFVDTGAVGTADTNGNLLRVNSGNVLGSYGTIRSLRSINYKIAQGAIIRVGAIFSTPQANSWSGAGGFNVGDEVSFGYNGTDFGVWHRYDGKAEVRSLQITVAAGGGETAVIVINGVTYNIPLTAGTVNHNAYEIATYLDANGVGFEAEQLDDTVIVDFTSDGAKSDTYSFSSATATATWSQSTAGITKQSDHTIMADWNGVTPANFDPTKGNNYQIVYQNGFGNIEYQIADPVTSEFKTAHTVLWGNVKSSANLYNPSLHVGIYATALSSITPVEVESPYLAGFTTSEPDKTRNPRGYTNSKSISTTLTNIFTIRNSRTYNGIHNQVEIFSLQLTLTNDGAKNAIFYVYGNPTVSGDTNFQSIGTNLVTEVDVAGGAVTAGRIYAAYPVAAKSSITIDLSALGLRTPPGIRIGIAGKQLTGGASADLSASLTWYENI